jgi:hypothetical protein
VGRYIARVKKCGDYRGISGRLSAWKKVSEIQKKVLTNAEKSV